MTGVTLQELEAGENVADLIDLTGETLLSFRPPFLIFVIELLSH